MIERFYSWLHPEFDRMPPMHKVTNMLLLSLRRLVITAGFRSIWQERFGERKVWLNFDDNFSIHRRLFPRYGLNLATVARMCRRRDPEFRMIDIGTSFGDGIATVLEQVQLPILGVEPSSNFKLLKKNFSSEPEVELVNAYIADGSPPVAGPVPTLSLESILEKHPSFAWAGLIKVDTDGHDLSILRQNEPWLRRAQPILFFEYDPHWEVPGGATPVEIFPFLASLGYERALVYDLGGLFMLELNLNEERNWKYLTHFLRSKSRISYVDICAFPLTKGKLADEILAEEMKV